MVICLINPDVEVRKKHSPLKQLCDGCGLALGEKRSALLAEVARLREERGSESEEAAAECVPQQPCRGTVSITNIQLPLKVEFVCSSHSRAGKQHRPRRSIDFFQRFASHVTSSD